MDDAPKINLLVIPSAEGNIDRDVKDAALLEKVRRRVEQASLVLTLCDGAFVLAATGALDGREATTFPGDRDAFAKMFPKVKLRRDVFWSPTVSLSPPPAASSRSKPPSRSSSGCTAPAWPRGSAGASSSTGRRSARGCARSGAIPGRPTS